MSAGDERETREHESDPVAGPSTQADEDLSVDREATDSDDPLTAEFDILDAGLDREVEPVESENPRDTLSPAELETHIKTLDSVAKARERANATDD